MAGFLGNFFTRNVPLKILSFILALLIWFYIVNELEKGSQEEAMALHKILQKRHIFEQHFEQQNNAKIRR